MRVIRTLVGPLFAAVVAIVPMVIIFIVGCRVPEATVGLAGGVTTGLVLTLWVIFLVVLGRQGHFQWFDRILWMPLELTPAVQAERKAPDPGRPLEYRDLAL